MGKKTKRNLNILLFKSPGDVDTFTSDVINEEYEANLDNYIGDNKDNFVCLVPPDTLLTIMDVVFRYNKEWDELLGPWYKVKTPDGTTGWFCIVYGD